MFRASMLALAAIAATGAVSNAQSIDRNFNVYFGRDQVVLTAEAGEVVDAAAAHAQRYQGLRIRLTGHTDTLGSAAYNLGRSERMARAVQDRMVARGVDARRISIIARGESQLAVRTGDEVADPLNRRVEIVLSIL